MAKAKKLFLLREKREIWRVRIDKKVHSAMCPECGEEVTWLTCAEAARVSDLSERDVFHLTERREIRFAESEAGSLRVCMRSLERTEGLSDSTNIKCQVTHLSDERKGV